MSDECVVFLIAKLSSTLPHSYTPKNNKNYGKFIFT